MAQHSKKALVTRQVRSTDDRFKQLLEITVNGLSSKHTKRAYQRDIEDFLEWWQDTAGGRPLNKAALDAYRALQHKHGRGEAAINRNLSAVRRFISDAVDNNLIDPRDAESAKRVKNFKQRGQRQGRWLTLTELKTLIHAPSKDTLRGRRDCAALALLAGAGLRRNELSSVNFEHIQKREGRWVIVDLVGKGAKKRTVPIADWVHAAVAAWRELSDVNKGRIFRRVGCPVRRSKKKLIETQALRSRLARCPEDEEVVLDPYPTSTAADQEVYRIVKRYADQLELALAPHDLRRTYAKLSRSAGAELEQIQLTLGHQSLSTTERYLGTDLNLKKAPSDLIEITI